MEKIIYIDGGGSVYVTSDRMLDSDRERLSAYVFRFLERDGSLSVIKSKMPLNGVFQCGGCKSLEKRNDLLMTCLKTVLEI